MNDLTSQANEFARTVIQREDYVRQLEAEIQALKLTISTVNERGDSYNPNDPIFSYLPPDQFTSVVTLEMFQRGWREGLFLDITEAGLAAGKTPQRISDAYRRNEDDLSWISFGKEGTTFFFIGWVALKWPNGPGTTAWRKGIEPYKRWAREKLIRPEAQ